VPAIFYEFENCAEKYQHQESMKVLVDKSISISKTGRQKFLLNGKIEIPKKNNENEFIIIDYLNKDTIKKLLYEKNISYKNF